jgi:hypothetical protein
MHSLVLNVARNAQISFEDMNASPACFGDSSMVCNSNRFLDTSYDLCINCGPNCTCDATNTCS